MTFFSSAEVLKVSAEALEASASTLYPSVMMRRPVLNRAMVATLAVEAGLEGTRKGDPAERVDSCRCRVPAALRAVE